MKDPEGLRYTKDHEWVRIEGNRAVVGITDHAQSSLGDIVYVELPKVGSLVSKGEEATNIESVKAAAAVYAPVSGTIREVNLALDKSPELVNQDPYGSFIFTIEMTDPGELEELLSREQYEQLVVEDDNT